MGRAYRNFWSLNTDEAVVAGILRDVTSKDVEVLLPLNSQMKDIDLVLMNTKNKKTITIQVKGSKAYEPNTGETYKNGDGSSGWFSILKKVIENSTADYFIFLVYVLVQRADRGRRTIEPHLITVPTKVIRSLARQNKANGMAKYNFYFWVNTTSMEAFDWRDTKYSVSDYLDKKGFDRLNNLLT